MNLLPPIFPFRRRMKGPEFFRLTCEACGFDRQYELAKNYTVYHNPECDHSAEPEVVEELPAVCPKCGGALKKERLPVRIFY